MKKLKYELCSFQTKVVPELVEGTGKFFRGYPFSFIPSYSD